MDVGKTRTEEKERQNRLPVATRRVEMLLYFPPAASAEFSEHNCAHSSWSEVVYGL